MSKVKTVLGQNPRRNADSCAFPYGLVALKPYVYIGETTVLVCDTSKVSEKTHYSQVSERTLEGLYSFQASHFSYLVDVKNGKGETDCHAQI